MPQPKKTSSGKRTSHTAGKQLPDPGLGKLSRLPTEVHLLIVKFADNRTLRVLSRVSSACRTFCFEVLFQNICFLVNTSNSDLRLRMEKFCSVSRVNLATRANLAQVRSVKFRLRERAQDGTLPKAMMEALRSMPNLTGLCFEMAHFESQLLPSIISKFLEAPKLGITRLQLFDGGSHAAKDKAKLIKHCNRLEALSIFIGKEWFNGDDQLKTAMETQPQLRKLHVEVQEAPYSKDMELSRIDVLGGMGDPFANLEWLVLSSAISRLGLYAASEDQLEQAELYEIYMEKFIGAMKKLRCLKRLAFNMAMIRVSRLWYGRNWGEDVLESDWGQGLRRSNFVAPHFVHDPERLYKTVALFRHFAKELTQLELLHMDMREDIVIQGLRKEGNMMGIKMLELAEIQRESSRFPFDFREGYEKKDLEAITGCPRTYYMNMESSGSSSMQIL